MAPGALVIALGSLVMALVTALGSLVTALVIALESSVTALGSSSLTRDPGPLHWEHRVFSHCDWNSDPQKLCDNKCVLSCYLLKYFVTENR